MQNCLAAVSIEWYGAAKMSKIHCNKYVPYISTTKVNVWTNECTERTVDRWGINRELKKHACRCIIGTPRAEYDETRNMVDHMHDRSRCMPHNIPRVDEVPPIRLMAR